MEGNKQSRKNPSQKPSLKVTFYLICLGSLFFISCSRYQCVSIDSPLYKNEKNEFVAEDDTVQMKYSFSGKDFPVTLTVYNKLQQPLYFDLGKSMIVMNNDQITDAYDSDDKVFSIAPQSSATIKSNHLSNKFIPLSPQDKIVKATTSTAYGSSHVRIHVFNEDNSPVYFTSVLAFSIHKDLSSTMFYDHPFWVSGVYETVDNAPSQSISNQFYMEKTTGFATFVSYTGAIALLVALTAVTPAQE